MQPIDSRRLTYQPLTPDDWPFFLQLYQDRQVMAFVADPRPLDAIRAAFDARLPTWQPGASHWLCLLMRDKESGSPVGLTGYLHHEPALAEVGFLLDPAWQGIGYAHESLRTLCEFAFGSGGVRKLTATVTAGNLASRKVLEKSGFQLEGTLRESWFLDGRWQDDWLFGLLKHEYR